MLNTLVVFTIVDILRLYYMFQSQCSIWAIHKDVKRLSLLADMLQVPCFQYHLAVERQFLWSSLYYYFPLHQYIALPGADALPSRSRDPGCHHRSDDVIRVTGSMFSVTWTSVRMCRLRARELAWVLEEEHGYGHVWNKENTDKNSSRNKNRYVNKSLCIIHHFIREHCYYKPSHVLKVIPLVIRYHY